MFLCYFQCCQYTKLQWFDADGWASGRAYGVQKLSDEVLAWLSVWSDATASSLASLKYSLV